jgi:hypothetical protein
MIRRGFAPQPPVLSYTIDVEVTSEAALRTCNQVLKNNHMRRALCQVRPSPPSRRLALSPSSGGVVCVGQWDHD